VLVGQVGNLSYEDPNYLTINRCASPVALTTEDTVQRSLLHSLFCGTILLFASRAIGSEKTDAFGDPLPKGAIARIGTTKYHMQTRHSARLSPDGKRLAVLGRPGEIEVWDLPAWNLAFTPEGTVLALAGDDHFLYVWEVCTGKMLSPTDVPRAWIDKLSFSLQGELYVASGDGHAAWWNPRTGGKIRDHKPDTETTARPPDFGEGDVYAGVPNIFDNGMKVASLRQNTVWIWDTRTGRNTARFVVPLGPQEDTSRVAVSPNGNYFAITTTQSKLLVWDQAKKAVIRAYPMQAFRPARLVRISDRSRFARMTVDFEVDTGIFSPDSSRLAFFGEKNRLQLIRVDRAGENAIVEFGEPRTQVLRRVFSPDGRQLACAVAAVASDAWKICVVETASGKIRRE
jgi:WD40 repeat protein